MNVQWQRDDPVTVEDTDALDALLDRLHDRAVAAERLIAVFLFHTVPGPVLTITVGAGYAVAQWSDPPGAYEMTSLNTDPGVDPGRVCDLPIDYGGQASTVPAALFFPAKDARAAACTFHTTGRLPAEIPWPDRKPARRHGEE